ncbi:MAG: 2Fe-2S iron-sulfur cluster binding domain-containing protein [Myxococcales bacterium]|nr:2Fe-2S iron-sulfur cluster binding domain-containing protein [Myxococcales bacterium]
MTPPETQLPAAPATVTLTIDGRQVTVQKGTNVLEAARAQGTDISYFCYHPGLSSPAVCRQCLVEVAGQPKLVPSCYTPVADNMVVITASERVLTARRQMLEFTLVNHPVDCPICDKAGECTLQKLYMEWDGHPSRSDVNKVHKPKVVDLGPTIVLDAERCILCTRCIRVCDEVAHQHQLTMAFRGDHEILTTAPGQVLDNPYSLNTVDVCPVGALTSKDFRFKMRAWELYTVPSVCPGCATGCNVEIHHAQGQAWRLVPRPNPDINKFWMCDEGRLTYKELTRDRVVGARLGDDPAPLEKAINYAAERIEQVRQEGGTVAVVLGAQATNEDLYLAARVAIDVLSARVFIAGRPAVPDRVDEILRSADVNPNSAGAKIFGRAAAGGIPELERALQNGELSLVWAIGEDLPLSEEAFAALDDIEMIVQASHEDELTAGADVVLPAAMWAEVDGTFTNVQGLVQRIRRALDAPGGAKPHWELTAAIARRLGVSVDEPNVRALFNEMKSKVPEMAGAEWGRPQPLVQLRFANSRG